MKIDLLNRLEEAIAQGMIPSDDDHFAGAGLVISDDPNRNHEGDDVFVCLPTAGQISWVVRQIKEIFDGDLDHLNKLTFYPELGRAAQRANEDGASTNTIARAIVEEAKNYWSNRPLSVPTTLDRIQEQLKDADGGEQRNEQN
jgi:hypothetical protein